eukprot:TRINITY_DN41769_c0_g1_i1.p1 TRINITY_DN41769_c0_g1~~TRINITY_DN41769_c0_g1_i1.p1  ORF type:complete len:102 (+),score=16.45 TRINITY_DN41769_c0_g1_i1:66-371(+)
MIRRPPTSTLSSSSAASDVYKRQHHHHSSPKAGGGEGVTSTTEGGVYSKYLTPTSLRSAQLYYSKLLSRKEAGDDDALSWLLAKFPILSTSYWRSKFEKGK